MGEWQDARLLLQYHGWRYYKERALLAVNEWWHGWLIRLGVHGYWWEGVPMPPTREADDE